MRNRNKPVSPACCANSPATPPLTISIAKNESGASGRVLRLRCCCATSSRRQSRRASTWFQGNSRVDELFLPRRRLMPAHVPLIQYRPPAANPSVTLRLGLAPSQEIAPLGSVHIAAKHLAEHALNGCFSVRFAGKHAPPPSRFLDTNFTPGSPDARNVTTRAACCRFNHDVLREFPVPCLTAQAAPAFGHIAGDRRPSSLRSCLRPKD